MKTPTTQHYSAPHYSTAVLTIPGTKQESGGQSGAGHHHHPPHSTQNITVVPVPSTGIMTAGKLGWRALQTHDA